MSDEVGAG